jgi:hypothetical protein
MSKTDAFVAVLAIVLGAAVLLSPVACTINRHRIIAQAIKDGADPIAARCAIEGDTGYTPACIINSAGADRSTPKEVK